MFQDKIKNLITLNNLELPYFEEKLYKIIILGIFEEVCKEIKKSNNKIKEKEIFRKSYDKVVATKMLIDRYYPCKLNYFEYLYLSKLFIAFFNKENQRHTFNNDYKKDLLNKQNYMCALCKSPITLNDSHLDHIISWNYVGDNLKENHQMLCVTCNKRKGDSIYYEFTTLLKNQLTI